MGTSLFLKHQQAHSVYMLHVHTCMFENFKFDYEEMCQLAVSLSITESAGRDRCMQLAVTQ